MAPVATSISIRLTEQVVYLIGGVDHERARARRRATGSSTPLRSRNPSRPGSRPSSRPPSPPPGISILSEGHFVSPSPNRGMGARTQSPSPLPNLDGGGGNSRSASRTRFTEGTTTGSGTREESEAVDEPPPAVLRGLLTLTLAKPSRIRDITVKIKGTARTDWPEGIGARRLEVNETFTLISQSWTFFSASDLADERRAASIGPGVIEGDLDRRGRSGNRRAASMMPMPIRAGSAGLNYPTNREARDHIIDESEERDDPVRSSSLARTSLDISSLPPPVNPGEPSPAYEAAPRIVGTPSPSHSVDTPRRPHFPLLTSHPTHPRSPLGPSSPVEFTHDTSQPSTPHSDRPSFLRGGSSTDDDFGASSNGSLLTSTASILSDDQPRTESPSNLTPSPLPTPTHESSSSSPPPPILRSPSSDPDLVVRDPSLPRPSSIISRRAPSTAPPPSARSASSRPSGRFSLGAIGDALRGKSTSRVRDSSENGKNSESRGRGRNESPGSRAGGIDRNESRGRKTALKVLRDRLTAGLDPATSLPAMMDDSDEEGEEAEDEKRKGKELSKGWKEFRAGTYTYPISIPIPASLPPTLLADFGQVHYTLKATVHRAGALTSNLVTTSEIICVSCPGSEDTEESESIVVERSWEDQLIYQIALSGKIFPIGGLIPISIRLNPMAKIKFTRFMVVLEQKVSYFGSNRKLVRHEIAKKFQLLKIENVNPKEPLLPILSDSADAIKNHPLADFFINPTSSDDTTPSLLDPLGPWLLESNLQLPDCSSGLKFSTAHDKANITVSHLLKVVLRVQRGDDDFLDTKGNRKLWDVIIETPIHVLSCHCTQTTLPTYSFSMTASSSTPMPSSTTCCHDRRFSATSPARTNTRVPPSAHARTSQSPAPQIASLAENLLFAQLVAGEVTTAGEIPPSYDAVRSGAVLERRTSSSSIATARGRTSIRGGATGNGSSPGSATSTSRGRSESVDTIAMSRRYVGS